MSSIITGILGSTVGLLFDKARDSAANKLKDGDLADEKLREIIVKDLSDIKSKLDCLSFKDLDSSYSFLEEGVQLLNLALDKLSGDQRASEVPSDEAARAVNNTASGVLNAALSLPQAIQKLKVECDERFVPAKDRFKASREQATIAFNNKSLSIKDRIMACKLRVAATILESGLEDPEVATTACLVSLKELHGLPKIQEMFAVFLKGGLKSMFKKSERLENIMSVLFINHALYDFTSKYSSTSCNPFTWPGIELKDRTFHPILNAHEIVTNTSSGEDLVQQLNRVIIDSRMSNFRQFAINSRGHIIILNDSRITVVYSAGESKDVSVPSTSESDEVKQNLMSIAVDSNDNVYVVSGRQTFDDDSVKEDFVLYVFHENYNIKLVSVLDFLHARERSRITRIDDMQIAVDKNQNLIILPKRNNQVYVCDNTGKLKFQFERDGRYLCSLDISNNNDIMTLSRDCSAVRIYSTEGNLKSIIKAPEGHAFSQAAFHHGIGKIILLSYVQKQNSRFLLSYSEAGELENSVFLATVPNYLGEYLWLHANIKSHSSGPVAVRVGEIITLI